MKFNDGDIVLSINKERPDFYRKYKFHSYYRDIYDDYDHQMDNSALVTLLESSYTGESYDIGKKFYSPYRDFILARESKINLI